MVDLWNIGYGVQTKGFTPLVSGMTRRMAANLSLAVRDSLVDLETEHKTKQVRRGGGPPVEGVWTTRKGHLRRSFHRDWTPGAVEGAYGSDLARAAKVERGGKITSDRPGGSLAIPTRYAPKEAWPRDIPDLFFKLNKAGEPMLYQNRAGRLRPMFRLVKSVTLPPRPALDNAAEATEGRRDARFLEAVDRSLLGL